MKPLVNGTETEAKAKAANQNANFGACFANPTKIISHQINNHDVLGPVLVAREQLVTGE